MVTVAVMPQRRPSIGSAGRTVTGYTIDPWYGSPTFEIKRDVAAAKKLVAEAGFGPDKPVCSKCPVHCYRPELRERIRGVMRYAGPRMLYRHPVLALRHQWHAPNAPLPPIAMN